MATDPYWQLEKEYFTLTADHDLTVKAIEYKNVTRTDNDKTVTELAPAKVHEYRVNRDVLTKASLVLRKLLTTANFRESEQSVIELHEDPPQSLKTWLEVFHEAPLHEDGVKAVEIQGVWDLLVTAHKYEIDPASAGAKAWFATWWAANVTNAGKEGKRLGYVDYQTLLLPCWSFDFAPGWLMATKHLVYRANGHITERRPQGFYHDHLHIPANIIQQLNAAKGRLKTILHRELYNPIEGLLRNAFCGCKTHVLYAYEKSLTNTGVWPLESNFVKNSVWDILRSLETFHVEPALRVQTCGDHFCSFVFESAVQNAIGITRSYFDGLCLDCMNASRPKLGDADQDYWHHANPNIPWNYGCRVNHDQPTWYFSFMGKRGKMVQWTKEKRNAPRGGGHRAEA